VPLNGEPGPLLHHRVRSAAARAIERPNIAVINVAVWFDQCPDSGHLESHIAAMLRTVSTDKIQESPSTGDNSLRMCGKDARTVSAVVISGVANR